MAQPDTYNRLFSFTSYQAASPTAPLPSTSIDGEFNLIKVTLDQILANLALIQRDDTEIANATVGFDQLKSELSIGLSPPSIWATATNYTVNETVFVGLTFYRCLVSHTSGTFATDLAAGDWTLVADFNYGTAAGLELSVDGAGVTTLSPINDLGALEALASTGLAARTGTDTWAQRTITGTANEIGVADGGGVSANPTLSLPTALTFTGKTVTGGTFSSPTISGGTIDNTAIGSTTRTTGKFTTLTLTNALALANGGTAATDAAGARTSLGLAIGTDVEAHAARLTAFGALAATADRLYGADATGAASLITLPAAGLTLSTGALALANDLSALEGLASTGFAVRSAADTWVQRSLTAATGLAWTNGDGVAGDPSIALDFVSLTQDLTPAASDKVVTYDVSATAYKWALVSDVISAAAAGVGSIGGLTGTVGVANGIEASGSNIQISAARRTLPTVQKFLTGSGTYTTPANVLWIETEMVAGGGGGGGTSTGTGATGGTSTFDTWTAIGGTGGSPGVTSTPGVGGAGGSGGTDGTGILVKRVAGQKGQDGFGNVSVFWAGGDGGSSYFGGGAPGPNNGAGAGTGLAGQTNTGGGGSGEGSGVSGGGGGGGEYVHFIIETPASSYSYAVGAGGTAGAASNTGAVGRIVITEHYGS